MSANIEQADAPHQSFDVSCAYNQSFYPAKSFCYTTPGNCEMLIDLQTLLVLDNGSQYSHLITRRLRELDVYSEMLPCTTKLADLPFKPKGIILSGGKIVLHHVTILLSPLFLVLFFFFNELM